jgi:hypothetical protein
MVNKQNQQEMLVAVCSLWLATIWLALFRSTWGSLAWYDSKVGLGQCLTRPKGTLQYSPSRGSGEAHLRELALERREYSKGAFFYTIHLPSFDQISTGLSFFVSSPETSSGVSKLTIKALLHSGIPRIQRFFFFFTPTLPAQLHSLRKS